MAAFEKAGILPVNRERVLQNPLVMNQPEPLPRVPRGQPSKVNISRRVLADSDEIPARQEETRRQRAEKTRATKARHKEEAEKAALLAKFRASLAEEEARGATGEKRNKKIHKNQDTHRQGCNRNWR